MSTSEDKRTWTDEEIQMLTDIYEQKPCLWDIFHKDYQKPCLWDIFDKDYQKRDVKEKALAETSEELGRDDSDIKSKWNSIRGQYGEISDSI